VARTITFSAYCCCSPRPALCRELQLLAGAERHFFRRLDLDRFAGCRIAPHPRGALANLQYAKARYPDLLAALEMLGDQGDKIIEKRVPCRLDI
jgi:hypothetical protein